VEEMQPLYAAGADEVIPEEFETSVELTARVLRSYLIPRYEVEQFIAELRAGGYEMFRSLAAEVQSAEVIRLHFPDSEVATVRVSPQSVLAGLSLRETALRSEYGVTLLAILREGKTLTNPSADIVLWGGDRLIVFGGPKEVADASALARGVDR
jgi:CPA2 family monovalent cation:H+ antiporter-2